MNILTKAERETILEQLTLAPDEVLVAAYNHWHDIRDKVVLARGRMPRAEHVEEKVSEPVLRTTASERPNVCPGESSITKIGSNTKTDLLNDLREGRQPSDKYAEHMKLLWERGEVSYDGEEYYL